ncbi:hypothetical protein R3W88_001727 [Solanum pinnatisectum]|uniref:Uncharacterized protein n=1 Tax=Solanum pinnatisectum TaxID=50273 RepID=A0AAV9MLU3_9SOLN|nr:hypothetical protein R3W88_001727 [Solanum pinnatisectum]
MIQKLLKDTLKPIEFIHGERTVRFTMEEREQFAREEGLHQAQFDVKRNCNIGQLDFRHLLIRFDLYEDFKESGKIIEHYQKIVYDNLPLYCIHCKHQGHEENQFNPTNAYAIDLGDDSFDEDKEDNILDECFDKVARDGDISPRHQRSGSNKSKRKTHGRQHSWDGKVTGEFVPRQLHIRLAKQNQMTVSIDLTRSNQPKKK